MKFEIKIQSMNQVDDIEDIRERLAVETGLVVVGSADNNLRVSKRIKRQVGYYSLFSLKGGV